MATTNALRPQVETTIGWAMPVRVEDFLPSLSAYDQALSTIAALRLCHRHGKGDACFLKRLPTELVDLIEVYVHVASRQSAYVEWNMQEQCAWGQCACDCPQCQHGRPEHQGRSSQGPQPAGLETNTSSTARGMRKNSGILALTARKRRFAGATNGTHVCPHQTNLHHFALRTRDFRAVDADAKLVRKHFGLAVWTFVKHSYDVHPDDVRLRPLPMHLPAFEMSLRRDDDQHHRQILLMLPGSEACFEVRADDRKRWDEAFWKAPCPEGKMMRRFVRACRLLGLRSGRDLSSLERFADMGDDEDNETNKDLQLFAPPLQIGGMGKERSIRQIPSLDIVSVSRLSSWESRMRSDWLQRGAL